MFGSTNANDARVGYSSGTVNSLASTPSSDIESGVDTCQTAAYVLKTQTQRIKDALTGRSEPKNPNGAGELKARSPLQLRPWETSALLNEVENDLRVISEILFGQRPS